VALFLVPDGLLDVVEWVRPADDGGDLPSSMSVVSVMRICFFAAHETVSASAIRCDTSGAIASSANTCLAGL
jgi:hypothetical protein